MAGDVYEITRNKDTSQSGADGMTGSSHDQDTIVERVVAVRPDGMELEYDLSSEATKDERQDTWQLPARVFKPLHGPMRLVDRATLESRVDPWLKRAKLTRAACGRWMFTWNAFRIECDPESALKMAEMFDLRTPELRDGADYEDPAARRPAPLARKAVRANGTVFEALMEIDPAAVRRERAEADVVVGEIMRKPKTLEAALAERARETVTGTMRVTIETDAAGNVWRRTRVTKFEIRDASGKSETHTATETVERRRMAPK